MGIVGRRLARLEGQIIVPKDELRRRAYREFLRRLTPEEFAWLVEPTREAEMLADCPIHGAGCGCGNQGRRRRASEQYPDLRGEYERRNASLLERAEEIMAREPYRETEEDRGKRRAESEARQRASAERNRRYQYGNA